MSTPPAAPSGFLRTKRLTVAASDVAHGAPGAGAVSSISAPIGLTAMLRRPDHLA